MDHDGGTDSWLLRNMFAVFAVVRDRHSRVQLAGSDFRAARISRLIRFPVCAARSAARVAVSFNWHANALRRHLLVGRWNTDWRMENDKPRQCLCPFLDCCRVLARFWFSYRFCRLCLAPESNDTSAGFELRLCECRCGSVSRMATRQRGGQLPSSSSLLGKLSRCPKHYSSPKRLKQELKDSAPQNNPRAGF